MPIDTKTADSQTVDSKIVDTKTHSTKPQVTLWGHILTMLLLLVLALIARFRLTVLDFNSLLTSYLADDAFYYFKIAANISNLHRITYDGEQLSNGFHPLWMVLIAPFYTAANDGVDFVYRVQWIMLCCALLTVVALYLTVLRLRAGWWCATVVTAIFCVHSTFVDMQMNGLETSLNTLVLLLLFNAFLTIFLNPAVFLRRYVYFGFMAAATFLTRTDNGITLLLLFVALAWVSRRHVAQCWPRLFVSGMVALLLVSPWLLWNQIHFGSLIQGSGKVETIYWGEPHFSWGATAYKLLLTPLRTYENLQVFSSLFISPVGDASWMAGILLVVVGSVILFFLMNRCKSPALCALAVFFIAVFAVFCYHAGFRSFVRTWYHIPVGLVFLLLLAGLLHSMEKSRPAIALAGLCLSALWLASVLWLHSPAKLAGAVETPSSHTVVADWINANVGQDAVVGSMNSGVLSYLVKRKVVNLDGVVDQRSMRAHWEKRRAAYLHERGIRYLVDNDGALALFCSDNQLHTCEQVFVFGDKLNPGKVMRIVDK